MGTAVLFDLDGVLIDSRAAITGCMNFALQRHGLARRSLEELRPFIGPPIAYAFAEMSGQPVQSELVAACVAAYRERYAAESVRETTAYPGMADAVGRLAGRAELAIATSKPVAFAEPLLVALGLRAPFAVVAGPDLGLVAEDKAATVARALDALGRPERAVMIGDRSFDVVGARANRIPAVGVTWGFGTRQELEAAGSEVIIDTPGELVGAVERVLGGGRSD